MPQRNSPSTTRRDLRAMLGDGVSFSVMVGAGETYLPAFVLAVGLGELAAGLITSIPMLAGALLQLVAPRAVVWLRSYRKWIVLSATIQGLSFVPLVIAAWLGQISTTVAFLIASVYWGFGMATGPAWNTWAESIVPKRIRAPYFALRTRLTQAGVFCGFLCGGLTLQYGSSNDLMMAAYATIFTVAGSCRLLSAWFLSIQSETQPPSAVNRSVTPLELLRRFHRGGSERLLVYLVSVQFMVYIAAPYFSPFMLGKLQFSYATYMSLVAVSFVAKMLAMPALGKLAQRYGPMTLLWFGGIGIIPLSGLWIFSQNVPYLMFVQFLGGVVWAGYELGMFLLFFETIHRDERTSVLTLYNVANACAMVLGSLVGGAILRYFGPQSEIYLSVFLLSSIGRMGTLVLLAMLPFQRFRPVPIAFRITAVRPSAGSIDRPILPSLPDEPSEPTNAEQQEPFSAAG